MNLKFSDSLQNGWPQPGNMDTDIMPWMTPLLGGWEVGHRCNWDVFWTKDLARSELERNLARSWCRKHHLYEHLKNYFQGKIWDFVKVGLCIYFSQLHEFLFLKVIMGAHDRLMIATRVDFFRFKIIYLDLSPFFFPLARGKICCARCLPSQEGASETRVWIAGDAVWGQLEATGSLDP